MTPPTWSLRALLAMILVVASLLAALLHPTEDVAFVAGLAVAAALLVAIAVAVGTPGPGRSACVAFTVVCGLVLYQNQHDRQLLDSLPPFSESAAHWLNDRFGWAEWKGPPRTFVYWSSDRRVWYCSFDAEGNFRSSGSLSMPQAERDLGGVIALNNLPTEYPLALRSLPALTTIVSLSAALVSGLLAGWLAGAVSKPRRGREASPLDTGR